MRWNDEEHVMCSSGYYLLDRKDVIMLNSISYQREVLNFLKSINVCMIRLSI